MQRATSDIFVALLIAVALLVGGVAFWSVIGLNHITVVNNSGRKIGHLWLALPEKVVDIGPIDSGVRRRTWFSGSRRQGALLFEAAADGDFVRGCAGEYLDGDDGHAWSLEFLPAGKFMALDNGDPFPQRLCAEEAARGKDGWK